LHIRQAVPSKVRHHLPTRDTNALIVMTKSRLTHSYFAAGVKDVETGGELMSDRQRDEFEGGES